MISRLMRWAGFIACIAAPLLVFAVTFGLLRPSNPEIAIVRTREEEDPFSDEERIGQITDAFRLYAQAFDNHFPEADRIYGDELMRAIRIKMKFPPGAGFSPSFGFSRLTVLQRKNRTFRYLGSGMKLGEADRVLVHWSTESNKIQVSTDFQQCPRPVMRRLR